MSGICILQMINVLGDFNGHISGHIGGFDWGAWIGMGNVRGIRKEESNKSFVWRRNYKLSNTWSNREEKMKVTFRMGENETEIDFLLIKKEHGWYIQNVKAIPGEFQHALVIADIDKRKIRKVVIKTCTERRKISLLKDLKNKKRIEEKEIKLVDVGAPNLWGHIKDGIIKACDEVCGKKREDK